MSKTFIMALALAATLPMTAFATPKVGDVVGTNPDDATAALAKAGCVVSKFEAEDGNIEASCIDETKANLDIFIDPASGAITEIKASE